MAFESMRCPKCGLIQAQNPNCKSCGAPVPAEPVIQGQWASGEAPDSVQPGPRFVGEPLRSDRPRKLVFYGSVGTLFGIQIVNAFLTLLTLGIYSFWGRVKIRKYLMSQTDFEGDRFAYHGTGKELCMGSVKAGLIFGLPVTAVNLLPEFLGGGVPMRVGAAILIYCLFMVFIPLAMVSVRRYRMSRTSWRGIRFSFRGRAWKFIKLFIGGSLLSMITFGLYYPFYQVKQYAFMASNSYFGNQNFSFDGKGRDIFWSYVLALPLSLITFGLYGFWFLAKVQRYFLSHTSFGGARFSSSVKGGKLLLLMLGNLLLLALPVGLAAGAAAATLYFSGHRDGIAPLLIQGGSALWPAVLAGAAGWFFGWLVASSRIIVRTINFGFAYLSLTGALDLARIQQEAQAASATGEGLAGFFDLDFDFG